MRFYSIYDDDKSQKFLYPCITLEYEQWDDYGDKTKFKMHYYRNSQDNVRIGFVKILSESGGKTELKKSFKKLDSKFCSLGQSPSYYSKLKDELPQQHKEILEAINDVVFSPLIGEKFRDQSGFADSLLRNPTAKKALKEGHTYIREEADSKKEISFVFRCRVEGAKGSHEIPFLFKENNRVPQRLFALIGKNGTGKTQVLSKLAATLRGDVGYGKFTTRKPDFKRVLAISYSLFDNFDSAINSKSKGYHFCGLKKDGDYLNDTMLSRKIYNDLDQIRSFERENDWDFVLSEIVPEGFSEFVVKFKEGTNVLSKYSSGQSILISILSGIIANIQDRSILLFDEPETHLHPNAIGRLLSSLNSLLERFNSVAVISTHSPMVIQEIPSENVRVIERRENFPYVRKIGLESFGENLTIINNEVFDVSYRDNLYKRVFKKLIDAYELDEIDEMFDKNLGFNAKTFLANLK